jgi:hypothetical protein
VAVVTTIVQQLWASLQQLWASCGLFGPLFLCFVWSVCSFVCGDCAVCMVFCLCGTCGLCGRLNRSVYVVCAVGVVVTLCGLCGLCGPFCVWYGLSVMALSWCGLCGLRGHFPVWFCAAVSLINLVWSVMLSTSPQSYPFPEFGRGRVHVYAR